MASVDGSGYAHVGDVHLAYQVTGDGPLDLLLVPDGVIPIEMIEQEPSFARFVRRLESFARVIRFDRRGTGMSDPVTATTPPTLEQWALDAEAVLDAVSSERAALVGMAEGGFTVMVLAATRPERTTSLVLIHAFAGVFAASARGWGTIAETLDRLSTTVEDEWGRVDFGIPRFAPSAVGDDRYRDWLIRCARHSVSPAAARALFDVFFRSDVSDVLPTIQVPSLVIQRSGNPYVTVQHGRYLAEHIPGARYLEVDGVDHVPYIGDQSPILDAIEEFVTGGRRTAITDRFLATTLFTDIVDSTRTAAHLGDERWRELVQAHHATVRSEIDRFGGREVDTAGDGFFAMFDGPARAVWCASAIVRSVRSLGLEVRAGVHTGECEVVDGKPGGIAVIIGSRIAATASGGQVLVSRIVKDLLAGSGIELDDMGHFDLKGIPDPVRLYQVAGVGV